MALVNIDINDCNGSEYVLFPACCYNGNRFRVLKKSYPPMYEVGEYGVDMPVTITDVPRLEEDGRGRIEVTTGDVSVPCIGIYLREKNHAVFIYTVQSIDGKNIGLAYEKGQVSLTYPARRSLKYVWPRMIDNEETWENIATEIPYEVMEMPCQSMDEFYKAFYNNRKLMRLDDTLPSVLGKREQIRIQLDKYNAMNWYDKDGFYGTDVPGPFSWKWGSGWCGGAISSYPMMKLGGSKEYDRSMKTLAHLFRYQGESGFFIANTNDKGDVIHDGFGVEGTEGFSLVRRSADVLYFLFKHFELMEEVPDLFEEGARKCADAFVELYSRYGQLGQFVDVKSGEIKVGGSTAGALTPAALVSAYRYFGDEVYLKTAETIGEHYYQRDLKKGYTTGGPAEILQCPDSESAFALVESYVELYDVTRVKKWLDYACFAVHLASSWVVAYNYEFPKGSEFHRLGMKTIGSVFANCQNKHSAPGICTLSGTSLIKLYEFTGNESYYQLYREITGTISQYMSTDERPVHSWDVPKDAASLGLLDITVEPEQLPQGFICERVNMSDWESIRCVGGVFNGSCWPEVSNLLYLAEDRMPVIEYQ